MNSYVLRFEKIDKQKLMVVGGKGANLGELSRIEGIRVPEGFCVTTEAYKRIIGEMSELNSLLDQLSLLKVEDRERIKEISKKVRQVIEGIAIARDIEEEIVRDLAKLGEDNAYAVRSSATAEDLPNASFAGQQDTYLNIKGKDSILQHISKCWASLFTDRAVTYRIQNGFDHRKVYLSVVIQRMVFPQAAGIMFTADPVTSNRKVLSIDASFGLGEALVSGLVNADIYKVREGRIVNKKISTKKLAIYALEKGGTQEREIEPGRQNMQTLTDEQILQLESMGRKIEAYFNCPQDIEWCLVDHAFYIVQSRPITTLYPIPEVTDGKNHVFVSVGHQQNMTDAIRPLGMSMLQLLGTRFSTLSMPQAGGRWFLDVAHDLTSPIGRSMVLAMGKSDPLIGNAIRSLIKRKDFMKSLSHGKKTIGLGSSGLSWAFLVQTIKIYRKPDEAVIQSLMSRNEASVRDLQKRIAGLSGEELFTFIPEDFKELQDIMYNPGSMGAISVLLLATNWLNKNLGKWLGEKNVADILSKSVENNPASEMGLALLDVADVVRQYPEVIEYFHHPSDEAFFEGLTKLEGGEAVSRSLRAYLDKNGMRCSGELDITRPRWSEQPTTLASMILGNIKNFAPHAHKTIFEQGRLEAEQKAQDLLSRLEKLPGGKKKAQKTKKMINTLRTLAGYREYPKYALTQRFFICKQALLKEADNLVRKGIIRDKEDIYYLYFEELREAVKTHRLDYSIITKRKAEYEVFDKLTPPRVMTSEGEIISGEYNMENIPQGALAGIAVSSGVVEGRARVVLKMEDVDIEEDDILVTAFTDPSWSPLFVSIKGLVTEVGGVMTHGAVVAREYGLPAVAGVENATKLIKEGQRILVNGTEGYVQIL
ncbi:phosphoenolpyruvate synthase [Candidatus Formimonas warabiya]|uniref:Rifampicin phosphotransferase n=1 Tax=Formimonas warabiya TaxID=1761012 RepID=A0A3G1KMF2_FORW1|nr:phosphoenolpyruvate synthase [Candidatus Formimonas warabiya]ATW23599.1 phosphoenolpyruvate synthase [Candidatus Formimonas warabiya]